MSRIKAPANLPELVKNAFSKARADGDIYYYPTQVSIVSAMGIPFQLRYSPALASKPKAPPHDPAKPPKIFDPFADPPAALRIADLGPSHFLLLNKFAIIPEHYILATTDFKPQTHVLEERDLEATLACIEAYEAARRMPDGTGHRDGGRGGGDGLFAFFNCGDHSGASQPHRHIQLLPIARMKDGLEEGSPWDVLASQLTTSRAPFITFSEKISMGMSGKALHSVYLRLYREACQAVAAHGAIPMLDGEAPADGECKISYNMAMTKDMLVVCPRLAEGAKIVSRTGETLGTLSLNGTVLAGTALAKNELEWQTLNTDPEGLLRVLRGIGIPTVEAGGL